MSELKIGDKRKFSFLREPCEILEILESPDIKLLWKWTDMACPHCGKKIEKTKEHTFRRIELLIPESKQEISDLQKKHYLVALGFDREGKIMLFPKEKHEEILSKSKRFKGSLL